MPIRNLADHPLPYVTVRELAEYWLVSEKHIRKQVARGLLQGIRLGPRLCRVNVASAIEFERRQMQTRAAAPGTQAAAVRSEGPVPSR